MTTALSFPPLPIAAKKNKKGLCDYSNRKGLSGVRNAHLPPKWICLPLLHSPQTCLANWVRVTRAPSSQVDMPAPHARHRRTKPPCCSNDDALVVAVPDNMANATYQLQLATQPLFHFVKAVFHLYMT